MAVVLRNKNTVFFQKTNNNNKKNKDGDEETLCPHGESTLTYMDKMQQSQGPLAMRSQDGESDELGPV